MMSPRAFCAFCAFIICNAPFSADASAKDKPRQLRPVVVDGRKERALHVLAYVREYSTLASYTDTITMFREKMADFMLPPSSRSKIPAWRLPRVIGSRSYYRYTNSDGLDSVSDRCPYYFSWADWVGLPPAMPLPQPVSVDTAASYTMPARWGYAEQWQRSGSGLSVAANMLAGEQQRRWIPDAAYLFSKDGVDFERFTLTLDFDLADSLTARPLDLKGYTAQIESRGRGRSMIGFSHGGPVFVTTRAEVYILDREFVTRSEARKWSEGVNDVGVYPHADAPRLSADVLSLIARVEGINHDSVRTNLPTDERLAHVHVKMNFGKAALQRIKHMFGLDQVAADRKRKKEWESFRRRQLDGRVSPIPLPQKP